MVDYIEGHPIPQDITGFQFRLIGDMTVKQFAYLAASLVIGWVAFSVPVPLLIKIPIAAVFVLIGLILAFVPIQGIPADTMIMLFLKALFMPNQYVYDKSKKGEQKSIQTIINQPMTQTITHSATITPQTRVPVLTQTTTISSPAASIPSQNVDSVVPVVQPQPSNLPAPITADAAGFQPPVTTNSQVRTIPTQPKKPIAIPFVTDVPNLIIGVIKDSRGNVLPNILIEVKDRDDNPVRAFKTNALGQFASATPLLNGMYTISFEDPKKQHRFDTIELTTQGEIVQPLEIVSIDEREDLRKSLFENTTR